LNVPLALILFVVLAFVVLVLLFVYASCVVAARSDESHEALAEALERAMKNAEKETTARVDEDNIAIWQTEQGERMTPEMIEWALGLDRVKELDYVSQL